MFIKRTSDSARVCANSAIKCSYYSTAPATSRPITYEEAKEKIKLANQFGIQGLRSGVDIRKLWPTVEEIQEINQMRLHRTAREAIEIAQKAEREKVEKQIKREKEIDEKLTNSS